MPPRQAARGRPVCRGPRVGSVRGPELFRRRLARRTLPHGPVHRHGPQLRARETACRRGSTGALVHQKKSSKFRSSTGGGSYRLCNNPFEQGVLCVEKISLCSGTLASWMTHCVSSNFLSPGNGRAGKENDVGAAFLQNRRRNLVFQHLLFSCLIWP